jgi:hypothetical protein
MRHDMHVRPGDEFCLVNSTGSLNNLRRRNHHCVGSPSECNEQKNREMKAKYMQNRSLQVRSIQRSPSQLHCCRPGLAMTTKNTKTSSIGPTKRAHHNKDVTTARSTITAEGPTSVSQKAREMKTTISNWNVMSRAFRNMNLQHRPPSWNDNMNVQVQKNFSFSMCLLLRLWWKWRTACQNSGMETTSESKKDGSGLVKSFNLHDSMLTMQVDSSGSSMYCHFSYHFSGRDPG